MPDPKLSRLTAEKWSLLAIAVMLAIAVVVWPSLPAQVPIRWTGHHVDAYGSKALALLFLPLSGVGLLLLLRSGPTNDGGLIARLRALACGIFLIVYVDMVAMMRGTFIDNAIVLGTALLLFGVGLPRLSADTIPGARASAALDTLRALEQTNRRARLLFTVLGVAGIGLGLARAPGAIWIVLALLLLGTAALAARAYAVWPRRPAS
ncbi:MAG TPA: DUF1648 domain-containing protein [Vicinamibacterales bacterium]|nr:DUF1648 domain-containing protein [Vicinamibacterales bacterium]